VASKAAVEFYGPNRVGYLGPFTHPPAALTGEGAGPPPPLLGHLLIAGEILRADRAEPPPRAPSAPHLAVWIAIFRLIPRRHW